MLDTDSATSKGPYRVVHAHPGSWNARCWALLRYHRWQLRGAEQRRTVSTLIVHSISPKIHSSFLQLIFPSIGQFSAALLSQFSQAVTENIKQEVDIDAFIEHSMAMYLGCHRSCHALCHAIAMTQERERHCPRYAASTHSTWQGGGAASCHLECKMRDWAQRTERPRTGRLWHAFH